MYLTCKDWQMKGSSPNIQQELLPGVGIFYSSSQFIAMSLRGVPIFYFKDIFIVSPLQLSSVGRQGDNRAPGMERLV